MWHAQHIPTNTTTVFSIFYVLFTSVTIFHIKESHTIHNIGQNAKKNQLACETIFITLIIWPLIFDIIIVNGNLDSTFQKLNDSNVYN